MLLQARNLLADAGVTELRHGHNCNKLAAQRLELNEETLKATATAMVIQKIPNSMANAWNASENTLAAGRDVATSVWRDILLVLQNGNVSDEE
jgi:hypothetical protein